MFLNKDAIKINNVSMGQYLLQAEYSYNKVWGKDTGRNLKGITSGTYLGYVPKIKMTFRRLSEQELRTLAPLFNSAWQSLEYIDPQLGVNTIETYFGDWSTLNKNTFENVAKANESFEISIIGTTPQGV